MYIILPIAIRNFYAPLIKYSIYKIKTKLTTIGSPFNTTLKRQRQSTIQEGCIETNKKEIKYRPHFSIDSKNCVQNKLFLQKIEIYQFQKSIVTIKIFQIKSFRRFTFMLY